MEQYDSVKPKSSNDFARKSNSFTSSNGFMNNPSSFGPFDFDNVEQFMPQNAKRPAFTFGSSYDHDGHDDDHDESGLETLTYKVLDKKYVSYIIILLLSFGL